MSFLIFIWSAALIYMVLYMTKAMVKTDVNYRYFRLLRFVRVAPILAFIVLLFLVLTYFHTKSGIRLSHAWYVAQFWAYTAFLYCSLVMTKYKIIIIPMILTLITAIYNTPLFHYEKLFIGRYVIVSDFLGVLMFLTMWISTSKILTMKEAANG